MAPITAQYTPLDYGDFGEDAPIIRPPLISKRRILFLMPFVAIFASLITLSVNGPRKSIDMSSKFIAETLSGLASPRCPAHCPSDPFVKSGILHLGAYPNDTRWLPFPHDPIDALSHPLRSETIDYNAIPDMNVFAQASPQYMKMLSVNSTAMPWVVNKTILIIGSSHDRNNIQFMCDDVHGKYTDLGGHKFGYCTIPHYNLTLVNWFLYGMVDSEGFDWFRPTEDRPITFEKRFDEVMIPLMHKQGLAKPNLIIETSLFWDDMFFEIRAKHLNSTHGGHSPLTYSEINWHRSRVHALISKTRQLYGSQVPIMFRTRHLRKDNRWNRVLRIFQLDQSVRAIAEELGIKLFDWGGNLEGQTDMFYDDDQHFKNGPATWLAGDMMLFYLRRAVTAGCWQCHQWRD
ncbi:hypothetical protein FRB95_001310 [Tulasnella sp. JGI-2019a]|nr:hypothetical protein FRB93_006505 [Tulasnella sp. JGI-2019a]KAG9038453.1 hypothetical protein FRB95_001310 [Tulasnella sp. JGI-2019a]